MKYSLFLFIFCLAGYLFSPAAIYPQESERFIPDELYVQFSREVGQNSWQQTSRDPAVRKVFAGTPLKQVRAVFPAVRGIKRLPGMERTYRIKIRNPEQLPQLLRRLNNSSSVAYAERIPLHRLFDVPNDPLYNSQYHLALLQLDSAREIHHGDTSTAIAIIDGGVNYLHEDLKANIWVNTAEDVDGDGFLSPADFDSTDSDANGFVDDVIGWDFVHLPGQGYPGEDDSLADNQPMDFGGHGTHCAGDAAAVTDNGVGIASVGGKSRIMCIRAGMVAQDGFGYIYYSAQGIYYAAVNGARVISMSYGSSVPSQTEQQAVTFAYNQGAVCVAAAGNDNNNTPQYPANYNHVLAVAATNPQDQKTSFSNYGSWVDVSAPGSDIFSTTIGGYGNMSGTSMSAPIVAGLAGLTFALFPTYTPDQITNRILAGSDSIDHLNPGYAGQLGAGRVNAFKTLDKVIRVVSYSLIDTLSGNGNYRLDYGETVELVLSLKNSYDTVSGLRVKLKSLHPLITVTDSLWFIGNLPVNSTISNTTAPFVFTAGTDTAVTAVPLKVRVSADGGYLYEKTLVIPIGQREILIVNDDDPNATSRIGYYTEALDSLQRTSYDVWNISQQGVPGGAELQYPFLVWYTGEAVQDVLTPGEQQFLQSYLNSGGRLFLTGQNIGYDLVEQQNGPDFFVNYLHADYILNNANDYDLKGVEGDPIGNGEQIIILGSGGANNQNSPDAVSPGSSAHTAILYQESTPDSAAAVYYAGNYKLVYFAFGWEGINDQGPAKRHQVLERVLTWLAAPTAIEPSPGAVAENKLRLYPGYPNPFNPSTHIRFYLPRQEHTRLTIFNTLGQEVKRLIDQNLPTGYHQIKWDGKNKAGAFCGSGIYYIQIRAGNALKTGKLLLIK